MLPEGETFESMQARRNLLQETARSLSKMQFNLNESKMHYSPNKSVYMPSEGSRDQYKAVTRLGGHKTNIRALKGV